MHLDKGKEFLLQLMKVLILIVMEYALRCAEYFNKSEGTTRLNPYCNGICT